MLESLKAVVCKAHADLLSAGLVVETFGNVSGIDRARGRVVIKPSGLPYASLQPHQMVVVALADGRVLEGRARPSSDTPTHLVLYRAFEAVGGIVHTHSPRATAWAQAQREIPPYGTTHADYFDGPVPCTRPLTAREIRADYEAATGRVIVERFHGIHPLDRPAVLVASHGPFAWGVTVPEAVHHAVAVEFVAGLAAETERLRRPVRPLPRALGERHFSRKHGPGAYYGQR